MVPRRFLVSSDGSVTPSNEEFSSDSKRRQLEKTLQAKIKDPKAKPEQIVKWLALMALLAAEEMEEYADDPYRQAETQECLGRLKHYARLARNRTRSRRPRELDHDGPKVDFAASRIIEMMGEAVREALNGKDNELSERIMDQVRKRFNENDASMWRSLREMDDASAMNPPEGGAVS